MKLAAIILDGHVNGYGVARSLAKGYGFEIISLSHPKSAISDSSLIEKHYSYSTDEEFREIIKQIDFNYDKAILFYCSDNNLKKSIALCKELLNVSIPFINLDILNKGDQYIKCIESGVPVPKSSIVTSISELKNIEFGSSQVIVKPESSVEDRTGLFKAVIVQKDDFLAISRLIETCRMKNVKCIVSEYIEGDDDCLFTYGGYAFNGEVKGEFFGRKLVQRPPMTGVACIAESLDPISEVSLYGSKFIKKVDFTGVFQIEFKYSEENNEYYFIEFNPRNWLWGYAATVSGVNLPLLRVENELQIKQDILPFYQKCFFYWSEGLIYNIFFKLNFTALFFLFKRKKNIKIAHAIFNINDKRPFFASYINLLLYSIKLRDTLR